MPDAHEFNVEQRMEKLARDHPGGVICHRLWYQANADEMHHIVDLRYGDDAWTATGTSLGMAYCELRRKMEMGE
jgi:hypothetical protein